MISEQEIINRFLPVSLEEINSIKNSVKLLKRYDTKFVFRDSKVAALMKNLLDSYKILEIDGKRQFNYENVYFDTADRSFYMQHHNQKLNRYKLRYRKYVDSRLKFWEIKFKSNKMKTLKDRCEQEYDRTAPSDEMKILTKRVIPEILGIDLDVVKPSLLVRFSRVTLASPELKERITIDTNISFQNVIGQERSLNNVAVTELKQHEFSLNSPFVYAAKKQRIYRKPFSKYCVGMALLNDKIKRNRFKPNLMFLEKLSGGEVKCLSQ